MFQHLAVERHLGAIADAMHGQPVSRKGQSNILSARLNVDVTALLAGDESWRNRISKTNRINRQASPRKVTRCPASPRSRHIRAEASRVASRLALARIKNSDR